MTTVYRNIVVGIDGSKLSQKAFRTALQLAKDYNIHLYVAWIIDEAETANSAFAFSKILAEEQRHVEEEMIKKIQEANEYGLTDVSTIVEVGDPKKFLTEDIPEQYNADLIIIGATGMGMLQKERSGSTTSYVVDRAPCNVFVVKN